VPHTKAWVPRDSNIQKENKGKKEKSFKRRKGSIRGLNSTGMDRQLNTDA
jgi:hypothetical protein